MDITSYQSKARRTAKPMTQDEGLIHAALGCGSDMGEVATIIKAKYAYNKPIERLGLCKEIGDVCWFIGHACDHLKLSMVNISWATCTDYRYMASQNMNAKDEYWAMMGLKAAGDFANMVASRIYIEAIAVECLSKLYSCICQIAFMNGIEMGEVFDTNIDKLWKRYPEAYSDLAAITRADGEPVTDKGGPDIVFQDLPENGLYCSECNKRGAAIKQVVSPAGVTCQYGHGGAEGVELT